MKMPAELQCRNVIRGLKPYYDALYSEPARYRANLATLLDHRQVLHQRSDRAKRILYIEIFFTLLFGLL